MTNPTALRIVNSVAEAEGCSAEELDPLGEKIDMDALESLLAGGSGEVEVSLTYEGYHLTVNGDGRIEIDG